MARRMCIHVQLLPTPMLINTAGHRLQLKPSRKFTAVLSRAVLNLSRHSRHALKAMWLRSVPLPKGMSTTVETATLTGTMATRTRITAGIIPTSSPVTSSRTIIITRITSVIIITPGRRWSSSKDRTTTTVSFSLHHSKTRGRTMAVALTVVATMVAAHRVDLTAVDRTAGVETAAEAAKAHVN